MKIKNYLLMILFPIFMIFAFSPIVSAQDTEDPEVQTETQIDENEVNDQTGETEEKSEEEKKSTEPAREDIPQIPAETISGNEAEEKNETKKENEIEKKTESKEEVNEELLEDKEKAGEEEPSEEEKKYEIRFTYNDSLSILTGDTSTFLVCILSELNIKGNVTEVTSSNDKLFSATKEDGEWFINSYADFSTGENLYVTADNLKYNIKVICKSRQSGAKASAPYGTPGSRQSGAKASAPYGTPGSWNWNESGNYYTNSDIGNNTLKYYPDTGLMIITPSVKDSQLKKYGADGDAQMNKMFNNSSYRYLKHIEIEEGVGSIGNRFFNKIQGWGYTVTLPNSLHDIYGGAFKNSCLSGGVFIPSGVKEIESNTFDNCPLITDFFVPNTITSLGSDLFKYCTQEMNIYVENGLGDLNPVCGNNVGNRFPNHASCKFHWYGSNLGGNVYAFPEQSSEPTGHQGNYGYAANDARRTTLEIIGYGAINDYTNSGNSPVKSSTPQVSQVVFNGIFGTKFDNGYHKYVTKIGNYTFYNCTNITTVKLPSRYTVYYEDYTHGAYCVDYFGDLNLTTIGTGAFQGCTALTTINTSGSSSDANTFSTGITVINPSVFQGCTSLPSFTIQNTVTKIDTNAFYGCTSLASVTLPPKTSTTLTSLGTSAFQGCTNLTTIRPSDESSVNTFPAGVTTVGANAFFGDSALTGITIPTSVTSIGNNAFRACTSLVNITFNSGRNSLLTIGTEAFRCDKAFPDTTTRGDLVIPSNVQIGVAAFSHATNRFRNIDLSAMNQSIGHTAFWGEGGIENVYLSSGITSIGGRVFTIATTFWYKYGKKADLIAKMINESSQQSATTITEGGYSFPNNNHVFHFIKNEGQCGANLNWQVEYMYNNNADNTIRSQNMYVTGTGPFYDRRTSQRPWAGDTNNTDDTNNTGVTALVVGSGATTIGTNAFYQFTGLTSVTLPETLTELKYSAFGKCSALTSITIPASVATIGGYYTSEDYGAFQDCTSLTTVTFANNSGLTTIGSETFKGCTNLATITIPVNVTTIMNKAFYGCSSLTDVTIPTTIINAGLGANAFVGLASQADIYYPGKETEFTGKCSTSVENVFGSANPIARANADSYYYHFKCGDNLWYTVDGVNSKISIDEGSGDMWPYNWNTNLSPFNSHCSSGSAITTIEITSGSSIGSYAFYSCPSITSIVVPSSGLASVGNGAFEACSSLTSIKPSNASASTDPNTLPNTITTLNESLFFNCGNLTSFTIQDTVGTIGIGTFKQSGLISITIPNSVTTIGTQAFYGCSDLETVNFEGNTTTSPYSNNLTSIGQNAFAGLTTNADIWYRYGNKASLISKCYDGETLDSSFGAGNKYVYHFVINEGQCGPTLYWDVTQVYQYVDGTNDVDETEMNVTGSGPFYPYSDTADGITSFDNTHRPWTNNSDGENTITKVTISGATNITRPIFRNLTALKTVVFLDNNITEIQRDAFWGCSSLVTLEVKINGTVSSQLPSGLEIIGPGAFGGCTSLTSITIPASVTAIQAASRDNWGTFTSCTNLATVTFEGATPSITTIGRGAFYGCTALTSIKPSDSSVNTFPSGVTTLSQSVFQGCNHLPSFTIQNTVTLVGPSAFNGCTALVGDTGIADQLTIPSGITSIGNNAFNSCQGLKSVVFASGSALKSIGNYTFQKCQNASFQQIILPEGLESVGTYAFQNCSNLQEVRIPSTIRSSGLAASAFANLKSKADIYYNGTESEFTDKCTTSVTNVFGCDIAGTNANNYIYHFKCGDYVWYSLDATSGSLLQVNIYKDADAPPSVTNISTYNWDNSTNRSPFYSHGSSSTSTMNVDIGYGVTYIGDSIFQDCLGLQELNLPLTLNETGTNICNGCSNLERVVGSTTRVTAIKSGSFKNCSKLGALVNIISNNNNITSIGNDAFSGCNNLNINIPSSVTTIGNSAFYGCSKLSSVTISTGIISIGSNALVGLGTDSSVTQVDITYSGKEAALAAKCSAGTLTGSFGYEAINNGKYTFHFTQDITYISNGSTVTGLTPLSYTTATGTAVTLPTLSDTTSSSFSGWYTQQDPNVVITQMTPQKSGPYGDLTYYAKWIITEKAIIYLEVDGSTVMPSETYQPMSGETVNLSIPTKTGHAFLGWHFLQSLTDTAFASFVADNTHTDDVTVYAEWYERDNIPYWANSSQTLLSTVEYEIIKPWETTLQGGTDQAPKWYVLTGDVTFDDRITINGNVHLILKDGCMLEAEEGISVNDGNSITIYAQDSDYNYINQDLGNISKMELKEIKYTFDAKNTTYGTDDYDDGPTTDLHTGNSYEINYEADMGSAYSDLDQTTILIVGSDGWKEESPGVRYCIPQGETKRYYENKDDEGYYIATAEGSTKYYQTEDYVYRWDNPNDPNDVVWIDEDEWNDLSDSPFFFDTITKKSYYYDYDSEKGAYYLYEITDIGRTHKYYAIDSSEHGGIIKITVTDDIDKYNSPKTAGGINAGQDIDQEGAGIGGDEATINGDITIYGGNLTIVSAYGHAAVGTGRFSENDTVPANTSTITIHGGTLDVTENGGEGATIGGGKYANGGDVIITGGRLILNNGWAGACIGAGNGVTENTTEISLSWTNITDYITIKQNNINYATGGLTIDSDKPFVFAGEDKITSTSYATAQTIAAKGNREFTIIPYRDTRYVLTVPRRIVLPFGTLKYPPLNSLLRVQTSVRTNESTPLVRPYELVLTINKINFKRVIGESGSVPQYDDENVIVYDLLDKTDTSLVGVDKHFTSSSEYDYGNYRETQLDGTQDLWIATDESAWQGKSSGEYHAKVTFNVGLGTNGDSGGVVPPGPDSPW